MRFGPESSTPQASTQRASTPHRLVRASPRHEHPNPGRDVLAARGFRSRRIDLIAVEGRAPAPRRGAPQARRQHLTRTPRFLLGDGYRAVAIVVANEALSVEWPRIARSRRRRKSQIK